MNEKAIHLYELLQTDLSLCRKKGMATLKEIECCFQMSMRYWAILKYDVICYEFTTRQEEIRFFKKIKPLFTGEIEYYSLLYHAELFRVDTVKEDQLKFLERESRRLEKFIEENEDFYKDYKNGSQANDPCFFVRSPVATEEDRSAKTKYDREDRATSSHDRLVASLLALERYHDYVSSELAALNHGQ